MSGQKQKKGSRKKRAAMRRRGRMWAVCLLYAMEYNRHQEALLESFPQLVEHQNPTQEAVELARKLAILVHSKRDELDDKIQASSPRWRVQRMAVIDRNILRLASYELFFATATPPKVVINEAVELAKRYGAEHSKNFVNGILQQICVDNQVDLEGQG